MAASLGTLTLDLIARMGGFTQSMDQAARDTESKMGRISTSTDGASKAVSGLTDKAKLLAGVFGIGFGVSEIIKTADAYTGLLNRLKLVTNSQYELKRAYQDVFDIAQSTRNDLDSTAIVYQKFAQNAELFGISQSKVAAITKTVSQAVAISGSSAESSAAAIQQFGQSLASGVFRGEEFNSVAEQAPGLLKALAEGLGKTTGELRKMANEGKLTTSVVMDGLSKAAQQVQKDFDKTAITIGQSITQINNAKIDFIGNQSSESAAVLASALSSLAKNFGTVVAVGEALAAGAVTKYMLGAAVATSQAVAASIAKASADRAAVVVEAGSTASALRRAIAEKTAAEAQMTRARDTVILTEQSIAADRAVIASEIDRLKSTLTQYAAEKQLEQQRLRSQISQEGLQASTARMASLRQAEVIVTRELQAAEAQLAATTVATSAEYTAALNAQTVATGRLATSIVGVKAATIASAEASTAAAVATSGLGAAARGLMGFIGGPVGLIAIVATVAAGFFLMGDNAEKAKPKLSELGETAEEVANKFKTLDVATRQSMLNGLSKDIAGKSSELKDAAKALDDGIQLAEMKNSRALGSSGLAQLEDIRKKIAQGGDITESYNKLMAIGLPKSFADSITDSVSAYNKLYNEQQKQIQQQTSLNLVNVDAKNTTDKLTKADRDRADQLREQAAARAMQIKSTTADIQKAMIDAQEQLSALEDPSEVGKVKRKIAEMENPSDKTTQGQAVDPKVKQQWIDLAQKIDDTKDAQDQLKKSNEDIKKSHEQIAAAIQKEKEAYLSLADSQMSPIERARAELQKSLELIRKAMSGEFVAKLPRGVSSLSVGGDVSSAVQSASDKHDFYSIEQQYKNLPTGILAAVAQVESKGNPNALNQKSGAAGMFQFMPATAKEYGIDPFNVDQAANAAAKKISGLITMYAGDVGKALQAYNFGEGNLNKALKGQKSLPTETQEYSGKVLDKLSGSNNKNNFKLRQEEILELKKIDEDEGRRRIAYATATYEAIVRSEELSNAKAIAGLTDRTKSETALLDERYTFENDQLDITYAHDIDMRDKMRVLLDKNLEQDKNNIQIRRQQERDSIFQRVRDAQSQSDHNDQKIGMGNAQSQLFDQEFQIRKQYEDEIRDLQNESMREASEARKNEIWERINDLELAGDAEIEIARNSAAVKKGLKEDELAYASQFFGDFSALADSQNKNLAAIGKAAAITQATINGYVMVTKTIAEVPYPLNIPLGIAAGVAAAANVAKIAGVGFKDGGYTGDVGINDIAGVVHGKEFVSDASTTAKYRPILESMRDGSFDTSMFSNSPSSVIADVNRPRQSIADFANSSELNFSTIRADMLTVGKVSVDTSSVSPKIDATLNSVNQQGLSGGVSMIFEDHTMKGVSVEVDNSEGKVRLIVRDEMQKGTGKLVADQLSRPNSDVSKAVEQFTSAERKRG